MLQRKQGDVMDRKCQEQGHPGQESQPCQDCVTKTLKVNGKQQMQRHRCGNEFSCVGRNPAASWEEMSSLGPQAFHLLSSPTLPSLLSPQLARGWQ